MPFDSYMLMNKCWKLDPKQRPTFSELLASLDKTLTAVADYMELGLTLQQPELEEQRYVEITSSSATITHNLQASGMINYSLIHLS